MRQSILAAFLLAPCALAQKNGDAVPLWRNGAPGSEAMADRKEVVTEPSKSGDSLKVSNIHNPSPIVYLPKEKVTGAAMIVAPGGGHRFLSIDTEGTNVAEWNVNPAKIGVMGFSAGGEVAAMASTRYDLGDASAADSIERQSSKPDDQIPIYPGIRAENVSVTRDTPPTFMLCADNDKGPSLAIPALYLALKKVGVPAELHIYNSGGHGFGYRPGAMPVIKSTWVLRLQDWMSDIGMSPAR